MGRKVMLVRGGKLGPNTGIGGAHYALVETLERGHITGWSLSGVQEYDLGAKPSAISRLWQRWFAHPRRIKSISNQTELDLIHITDQEQAHLVPHNSSTPVAVTVHDLFHLFPEVRTFGEVGVPIGDTSPSLVRRRDLRRLKDGLNRANLLICDSKSTLAACRSHFPNVDAVWLPLGLNMEKFDPTLADQTQASQPARGLPKACHLLIIGSHDPRKRMEFLFEVLGGLDAKVQQDIHVHHVGSITSPNGAASITDLARIHSLPNFTSHGGNLSDSALMDMRHACEALLFPSVSEGFGYPPIESMATGTRVLCSDAASHNELMPIGSCLASDDAKAWSEAILAVHSEWEGRSASDEHHVWPKADEALVAHAKSFDMSVFNQRTSDAYGRLV